ncbi:MAG: hypothetical protein U0228_01265 [Myxococcaceae bacterium]
MRTALLTLLTLAAPALAQESIFPTKSEKDAAKQLEPEVLSNENKAFLKGKMKNHIKDMKDLSIAVATVKLKEVERLAQGIANAPRLDRNMGEASKLPTRFFDLQDELKKKAQTLADAGKANDMNASLAGYQDLISTCVMCHATFKAQIEGPPKK